MSSRPFNPLPTCPIPFQWDVEGRIAELRAIINDPATSESQKVNLETAIKLYREKELPGELRWIQDGKVVPHKDIDFRRPYWNEGYAQQLSSRAILPAVESARQPDLRTSNSHIARSIISTQQAKPLGMRPVLALFGPAPSIDITMVNDTGSNAFTVFDTDVVALGIPQNYMGFGINVPVTTPTGIVWRQQINVEIQLLDAQGNPVSDWIFDRGIVTPAAPGVSRLSGDGIRQSLYFATAPGNQHLYVAEKKNGIVEQLPVV
ncbi:hypothetical protein FQN52_008345 [Onygenales sp. PD_12]|nr:hypothetical protein FQN52_008345 [Onygenales sp. PD_12]KAK2787059.1 hypothetical protein FQN53_005759 [Emmonsiellopsis sp. PD_33]